MNLAEITIGVLVVAIVTTGFMYFYVDVAITAGIDLGPHQNLSSFRETEKIVNFTNTTFGKIDTASSSLPYADLVGFMINGFNALRLGVLSVNLMGSMVSDAATILGIPAPIWLLFWAIILIVVIYAMIDAVL